MKSNLSALIALVAMAGAAVAAPLPIANYYPLKMNTTYAYTDVSSGDSFVLKINEKLTVNNVACFKLARTSNTDFDVVSNDANGVRVHSRNFKGVLANFNPPVVFAPANFEVGKAITTNPNYKNPATGNMTLWTTAIGAIEDITVPAGTYKGCARLELQIKDEKLGTVLAKMNMWLAPGVGMVKRQGQFFGVFYVQQLTKFTAGQ
jgi:hypothetical protein